MMWMLVTLPYFFMSWNKPSLQAVSVSRCLTAPLAPPGSLAVPEAGSLPPPLPRPGRPQYRRLVSVDLVARLRMQMPSSGRSPPEVTWFSFGDSAANETVEAPLPVETAARLLVDILILSFFPAFAALMELLKHEVFSPFADDSSPRLATAQFTAERDKGEKHLLDWPLAVEHVLSGLLLRDLRP